MDLSMPLYTCAKFGRRLQLLAVVVALASIASCGGGSRMVTRDNAVGGFTSGIPAAFMGMDMHGGIITRQPWPSETFGALRLWDSDVSWSNVNLAPGVYDWTALDKWLAKASLHNVDTLYTFGRTPAWASSSPTDTSCGVSPGACDPPNDLNLDGTGSNQHWKDFVTAIATHNLNSTTGHIKYWEIWNEAANPPTWTGSVAQTVRMAQDARQIILGIDPQAIILSPSVIIESTTGRDFLQAFLQSGGGSLVDGIAFHGYVQKRNSPLVPENIVGYLDSTKSILATFGQGSKPLFDTEASWGDPTLSNFFDSDMRAALLARMYLLHWSSGATRFYWYQWNNSSFGTLWKPDPTNPSAPGTVLEPGIAYGQIYNWMVGAIMTSPCTANGSVWTCEFSRPNGYLAQAVWDASQSCRGGVCTASAFTFDPKYINYTDLSGNTSTLSGSTVAIGAKPILLQNQ